MDLSDDCTCVLRFGFEPLIPLKVDLRFDNRNHGKLEVKILFLL